MKRLGIVALGSFALAACSEPRPPTAIAACEAVLKAASITDHQCDPVTDRDELMKLSALEAAYVHKKDSSSAPSGKPEHQAQISYHANKDQIKAAFARFGTVNSLATAFGQGMPFVGTANEKALVLMTVSNGAFSAQQYSLMEKTLASYGAP